MIDSCPECGQEGYRLMPSAGARHTEDCKSLKKKLKGMGKGPPYCECPHCQTCLGMRISFLEKAFGKDNSCQRERDSTQQETREHPASLPSPRRD